MDAEQVNTVNRLTTSQSRPPAGHAKPGPDATPPEPASNPAAKAEDSVELSTEGKRALAREASDAGSNVQRELEISDNNEVVLKIRDQATRQVVRQIPAEEQVRLRQAIKEIVSAQNGEI